MSLPIAVRADEPSYDRDKFPEPVGGVPREVPNTPPPASLLMEFIASALPDERVWMCDSCGSDVAQRGVIDMEALKIYCKKCYWEVFLADGPAR